MQYMLLIYGNESEHAKMAPEPMKEMLDAYFAYTDALEQAGVLIAGDALTETHTATTVRVRDDVVITDGPFAETTEQLGGYYLIDVDDLDQALEWARKCPGAKYGSIEVRAVMNYEGLNDER
jgi:hypothetical protein